MSICRQKFAKRLKRLRLENNLTQMDIAKLLGVGVTTISNYETGRNEPSMEKLIILAKYFNVSVDYLIGNTDNRFLETTTEEQEYKLSDDTSKLLSSVLILYNKDIQEFNLFLITLLIEMSKS